MKLRIFIPLILLVLVCNSCEDWLQASSSTKLPGNQLFESREGFQDGLSGVYMSLGSTALYGTNFTWQSFDWYAYPYVMSSTLSVTYFQKHNYEQLTVKNINNRTWADFYTSIANINNVLRALGEKESSVIVNDDEYNLFRGELLALRAYLHFELMKFYGSAKVTGEAAGTLTIPYVTEYSPKITPQRSNQETLEIMLADLTEALDLLGKSDPVCLSNEDLSEFNELANFDGYWNNRHTHLNYYAALALAARINVWQENFTAAATQAQAVIDGTLGTMVNWVDPAVQLETSDTYKDWTFSTEHVFQLKCSQLGTYLDGSIMFDLNGQKKGMFFSSIYVDNVLFVRNDPVTGSQAGAEDLRGPAMLLKDGSLGYYCYKFYQPSTYELTGIIPLIRISEMYYILAENEIKQGNNTDALHLLDEVRRHRGISDNLSASLDAREELTKEYYREFVSEGVLFPYLKRNDVRHSIIDGFDFSPADFIIPFPEAELNYGRVQER